MDDDITRIGSTGKPRPSAVASCPLLVEEIGSNVVHKYSATCSNAGRDGAEVSSRHSRCSGVGIPKGQTTRRRNTLPATGECRIYVDVSAIGAMMAVASNAIALTFAGVARTRDGSIPVQLAPEEASPRLPVLELLEPLS